MEQSVKMSEIVGGLSVRELAEGGAVFEIKESEFPEEDPDAAREYFDTLEGFTRLECLDHGEEYEGGEPFSSIAKKMENLLDNGKIKKRILRQGYGANPQDASDVQIHYNGYVQYEALPFDSTYARKKPFSFTIGAGEVIEGLEIAVKSMKITEKAQFLIDPELAYRNSGLDRIPQNSTVLFEVELCGVMKTTAEEAAETNTKDFAYVYPLCLGQCVKGKRMFRMKDFQGAIREYRLAAKRLEEAVLENYKDQVKSDELLVRLYTNLLICYTHVQDYKKGCIFAQQIHNMAKNKTFIVSARVHFNHAKCLRMLRQFDTARSQLDRARNLAPNNPEIIQEFSALKKAIDESKKVLTPMRK